MIKAVIGLGNPGQKFFYTRHNIGFRVLNTLAERFNVQFYTADDKEIADVLFDGKKMLLIKPLTYMNNSGKVIPFLRKKGIQPQELLIIHDELELPFGKITIKQGGSARGHNGLRSIIESCGEDFFRLRFGIGRPEDKKNVPDYVLQQFDKTETEQINTLIEKATDLVVDLIKE